MKDNLSVLDNPSLSLFVKTVEIKVSGARHELYSLSSNSSIMIFYTSYSFRNQDLQNSFIYNDCLSVVDLEVLLFNSLISPLCHLNE